MEPWMAEARRQRCLERYWQSQPHCLMCEQPIRSEKCLPLETFGLGGNLCEACLERAMVYTQDMEGT